jgi:hypothetical protein
MSLGAAVGLSPVRGCYLWSVEFWGSRTNFTCDPAGQRGAPARTWLGRGDGAGRRPERSLHVVEVRHVAIRDAWPGEQRRVQLLSAAASSSAWARSAARSWGAFRGASATATVPAGPGAGPRRRCRWSCRSSSVKWAGAASPPLGRVRDRPLGAPLVGVASVAVAVAGGVLLPALAQSGWVRSGASLPRPKQPDCRPVSRSRPTGCSATALPVISPAVEGGAGPAPRSPPSRSVNSSHDRETQAASGQYLRHSACVVSCVLVPPTGAVVVSPYRSSTSRLACRCAGALHSARSSSHVPPARETGGPVTRGRCDHRPVCDSRSSTFVGSASPTSARARAGDPCRRCRRARRRRVGGGERQRRSAPVPVT